jgi:iron-sulfur cluster repair protein YtfE (RIC family)
MPVKIGDTPHTFSEPTALPSDCHRRIEMFLGSLQKVAAYVDRPLAADVRSALESALRYFKEAAPKHTADEEESVFPRLRKSGGAEVQAALATLDALEQKHRRANSLHVQVDMLGRSCLGKGPLPAVQARQFREAVAELASIYKEHIRLEDEVVFPIAGRTLSKSDKNVIAAEMASRRS